MSNYPLPLVLCLMGPTASGKTSLAINIAQHLPCEIISVDSAMVYRGLDIGTAKPSKDILASIPHHLLDICDLTSIYSAGNFYQDAHTAIAEIISRGKVPLLVGGTMMYFNILQQGLANLPQQNAAVRMWMQKCDKNYGREFLYQQLQDIDSNAAQRIHPHDQVRIHRALEVYVLSGKTLSSMHHEQQCSIKYNFHNLIISPTDRAYLHHLIAQRFQYMLEQGLCDEVKNLLKFNDLTVQHHILKIINYRQMYDYLTGNSTWEEMIHKAIIATRQFAKRQITWLKSYSNCTWFASEQPKITQNVCNHIRQLLQRDSVI